MGDGLLRDAYATVAGALGETPSEQSLEALCEAAERTTANVRFARAAFVKSLAETERGRGLVARFASAAAADASLVDALVELRLVGAHAAGEPRAAHELDARYIQGQDRALARMRLGEAAVEDVLQRVRQKLLVPDDHGHARIADYAGQGRLRALVQVVATREALDVARKKDPLDGREDDLLTLPTADPDPELAALRARFGADFRAAFEAAVRALTSRERNLLRMHVVAGAPLERIATLYGAHRATVVRWLAAARAAVLKATRAELRARTGATDGEIDSMLALVQSRLDLSLERWFKSTAHEADP